MNKTRNTLVRDIYDLLRGSGFGAVRMYDEEGKEVYDFETNATEVNTFYSSKPQLAVEIKPDFVLLTANPRNKDVSAEKQEDIEKFRLKLKKQCEKSLMPLEYRNTVGTTTSAKPTGTHMDKTIGESKFSRLSGTEKTSYQNLENVTLVIKHKHPVNEELRGARSRGIKAIYIKRCDERFRLPTTNLTVARAAARHVSLGGDPYDNVCESLWQISDDLNKLKEFVRYARNSSVLNEQNSEYLHLAQEHVQDINHTLKQMSGVTTYSRAVEKLNEYTELELHQDVDIEHQFQEVRVDPRVQQATTAVQKLLTKRKQFQESIMNAIENETFSGLRDMLNEADAVQFENPHAQLSFQVSQLGNSAQNHELRSYLNDISHKLSQGGSLNQFEYRAVKASLLGANAPHQVTEHGKQDAVIAESLKYQNFLDDFIPKW